MVAMAACGAGALCFVEGCRMAERKAPVQAATPASESAPAQWQYVPLRTAEQKAKGFAGGEMGQMAFTLAISPSDPNHMAMGIDTAAVYTTTDGSTSWQLRRRGILSNGVQSVAFDPKNPRVLWAAGLHSSAGTPGGAMPAENELAKYSDPLADGIYLTTDGGEHWKLVRNAVYLRRHALNEYFAFDPASFDGTQHRTVYAATHWEGLLKSDDAGATWRVLGFPKTIIHVIALHPKDSRQFFVAADTGLFRSQDAGAGFEKVGANLPAAPVLALTLNAKDPAVLYVALGEKGLWRSTDGGRSFERRMNGIPEGAADKLWVRLISSPANPDYLYADATQWGGPVPFWSHDGGATWQPSEKREDGFQGTGVYWAEGIVAHPTDANVAFHLNPVRKTTDGGRTWQYCGDGVSGFRRGTRTSIAFRPDDPKKMVFFFIDHGSVTTTDGGDTFAYVPPPRQPDLGAITTAVGACDPTPGSRKLLSAVGGWTQQRICISEDDGKTWTVQKDTAANYVFMAFHPQKPNVVYAGRGGDGLRSRDGGATWQVLPHRIRAMLANNGDVVFASRPVDAKGWVSEVQKSSDQGETWETLPGRITGSLGEIDVDPTDPNRLYAASHTGVWVFDGKGWTVRNDQHGLEKDGFGVLNFRCVVVDPTRPSVVYAGQCHSWRGTARGIFRSVDRGEHWENITRNLGPELTVWAITVSPHDGTVWLGTDYGNWKLSE
ncbi:MAG: hypothetical protein A3K19_24350 [Lentisphaerae bacterium RIFOXYB12_FULL_65_16]|nr:MAG: hypothetical protein A3K19_24350 [Lentisphaerae bacterium RIFOXYB12_FULL_65_16]